MIYFFFRLFGTTPLVRPLGFAVLVIFWYAYHIYQLAFIRFDYGYNMKVNVFVGKFYGKNTNYRLWIFNASYMLTVSYIDGGPE